MCIFIYDYMINAKNRRLHVQCIIILFYWYWHMRWSAHESLACYWLLSACSRNSHSQRHRTTGTGTPKGCSCSQRQRCCPRAPGRILYWHTVVKPIAFASRTHHPPCFLAPVSRVSGDVWFIGHTRLAIRHPRVHNGPFSLYIHISLSLSYNKHTSHSHHHNNNNNIFKSMAFCSMNRI